MNKKLKFLAFILMGIALNLNQVWADDFYTITFGSTSNTESSISNTTNASTNITKGTAYVTNQPFTVNNGTCYYGGTNSKDNIRIGKTGTASSLTIALSETGKVHATTIVVNAKNTGGTKNSSATLAVNDADAQTTSADKATDYTFTINDDIESIKLAGSASIYIYSIKVYYSTAVVETHKAYFYNGSTLLNTGGTEFAEGAAVSYDGSTPTSCDSGNDASTTFVGWATDTWSGKVAKASIVPTFYDISAGESLPNMGTNDVTYYAVFAKADGGGGAAVNTTMWSEDFTTKVAYNNATIEYTYTNGDSDTKTYNDKLAGGSSPELLIGKKNGSFKIAGIPTGGASTLTLSYRMNNTNISPATTSTSNVSVGGRSGSNPYTQTITISGDVSAFDLTFANSNSSNGRIDELSVKVATQAVSYSDYLTTCCTPLGSINGSVKRTAN